MEPIYPWVFGDLPPRHFNLIVADPPWALKTYSPRGWRKTANEQYVTSPCELIGLTFPVHELAAPDCLLLMWATAPLIDQQLDVLSAWGFRYSTMFHWRKVTESGKVAMGTGYRVRSMAEPVLVAVRGSPKHKPFPGSFDGVRRRHSEKPERFFEIVESCCPQLTRRVELFSRRTRPGWLAFGDQVGLFDECPP